MIKLNDYLYSGDTVLRILQKYSVDLREHAINDRNPIDLTHSNFLLQIIGLLEHNDFLTAQSQRIREFYTHMTEEYPNLAFAFKGRIKSLIRAEEKFNGYIVSYIHDRYKKTNKMPDEHELRDHLSHMRDLIAYRIIISLPKCQVRPGLDRREEELRILYELANKLPDFLEMRGFTAEAAVGASNKISDRIDDRLKPYFKDFIANPNANGYRSLHVTFYDNVARCYVEIQLRTKEMDDYAEIGPANHFGYEKNQNLERASRKDIPEGLNVYFDEAYERGIALQKLDLSEVDVNMFSAYGDSLINDGCGLLLGRLIMPMEHLSRFQSDLI